MDIREAGKIVRPRWLGGALELVPVDLDGTITRSNADFGDDFRSARSVSGGQFTLGDTKRVGDTGECVPHCLAGGTRKAANVLAHSNLLLI